MVFKVSFSYYFRLEETPVFIDRVEIDGTKGLIVTLSDTGKLSIVYLGMQPVKNTKIMLPTKNYDSEKIQEDTEKLMTIINNFEKGIMAFPKDLLDIQVEVAENIILDENYSDTIYLTDRSGKIKRIQSQIKLVFDGKIAEEVKLHIITPYYIVCDEPLVDVGMIKGGSPYLKIVNFRVISAFYPTNLTIKAHATYEIKGARNINDKGTKSTSIVFELPLNLILRANPAKSTNQPFKVTINTDKDKSTEISKLFKDLTENFGDADVVKTSGLSIMFILQNNVEVQIAGSNKNTGKYRVQSSTFEGLVLIVNQLCSRLQEEHQGNINFSIEDELECEKFSEVVSKHHKLFLEIKAIQKSLDEYSSLYTLVQKSILNKYKEKNPPKLNNLDFLLSHVHNTIMDTADTLKETERLFKLTFKDLIVWTEGMTFLLKLKAKLSENEYNIVRDTFPVDNLENLTENSWADITLANMTNFFKFYFSKSNDLQEIKEVKELDKWKKFFKSMFEKIVKKEGFISQ